MICPRCKQDMIVVEHQQIELDHCPNCKGAWFDAGELGLLLECSRMESPDLAIRNVVNLPATETSHKPLKCPICHRGMKEVGIGSPAINIDVCLGEDGLWFDGGEMHELLTQLSDRPTAGAEKPVFEFLGEVFKGTEKEQGGKP
ncbi:MAG: zf-TFIIB domain-containing protein [Chloroflexota bacterium]